MKMSLLDMVQNILSAMDSDEVNSISDTVESLQVAEVVRETYFEIISNVHIPSNDRLILLDALNDPNRPNYLKIPNNVKDISWVKYDYETDGTTNYVDIRYIDPEYFLSFVNSRSGSLITVQDFNGALLQIANDTNPSYWTTFDNNFIVFDSYNSSQDSTLQQSKSMCRGQVEPTFILEDTFIPDLDSNLFSYLLAEAKSVCFLNFKQISNSKEEQRSKRQWLRAQNNLWRGDQRRPYDRTPNYGRNAYRQGPIRNLSSGGGGSSSSPVVDTDITVPDWITIFNDSLGS